MAEGGGGGLQGARLRHGYVQLEAGGAAHVKGTFVRQGARSRYHLTEACLGAQLARHDVHVTQVATRSLRPPGLRTLNVLPACVAGVCHCSRASWMWRQQGSEAGSGWRAAGRRGNGDRHAALCAGWPAAASRRAHPPAAHPSGGHRRPAAQVHSVGSFRCRSPPPPF